MKFPLKRLLILQFLFYYFSAISQKNNISTRLSEYQIQPTSITSRWTHEVNPDNALPKYPRPQFERKSWVNLNGLWEYAITDSNSARPAKFDGKILVPYPLESALSGVQKILAPHQILWYKKNVTIPPFNSQDHRLIINFGAVDWYAEVYINGKKSIEHKGGYINFSADITTDVHQGNNEVLVKVYDPTDQGPNPHGKQTLNPKNIYYTPTSGIWQTVWLECIPVNHIDNLKISANIDNNTIIAQVLSTSHLKDADIIATAIENGKSISTQKKPLNGNKEINITLPIPKAKYWSPDTPFLYDLSIKLVKAGQTIDEVKSYFGMRKINIQKDEKGYARIFLNNKYLYNLGILDQGFWPDGLYTAPTDEALAYDIKAIKSMGFNTIRKHIKIEPERWYYYADKLGVLVWQDFVNPPHDLPDGSKEVFERETRSTIDQLYNHPSIVIWVLFNERWGAYDQQRLTKWVKTYDPSRLVNGHSGELLYVNNQLRAPSDSPWINSDIADIHSYPYPRNFAASSDQARVLGEYGGIGVSVPSHEWDDMQGWGYVQKTASELKEQYKAMIDSLKKLETTGLSGSIYTQPFDVEGEENGLVTYDREIIKIPLRELRSINNSLIVSSSILTIDPKFHIGNDIDPNDNDSRYTELLAQYENGKRDSAFLRRIILIATRKRDSLNSTKIGKDYYSCLKQPFLKQNLEFLSRVTRSTKDTGFKVFLSHHDEINQIIGRPLSEYMIKRIICQEGVDSYLDNKNIATDWDSLYNALTSKYGTIGKEVFYGRKMLHSLLNQDWDNFGKSYMAYYKLALRRPDYSTNQISWYVFLHVTDPEVIQFATQVMKYDLETWDQHASFAHDTYANLLHKANRSQEAIKWEEKALELKRNDQEGKEYAETLQKMKSGQPTWPTKN